MTTATEVRDLAAKWGDAYAAVIAEAALWYRELNGAAPADPFSSGVAEVRAGQAHQLNGMLRAAAAILKAAPHKVNARDALVLAHKDITDVAAAKEVTGCR
jgi:hypothetical protein